MRELTVVNASASRQSADEVEVSIEGVGGPWVTRDFPYGGQWRIYSPPKKEGLVRVEVKATYADGTTEDRELSEVFPDATLQLKGTRGGAATSQ